MIWFLTSLHRVLESKATLRVGEKILLQCCEGDKEWTPYTGSTTAPVKNKKIQSQGLTDGCTPDIMLNVK
jgi:hypothetical protein